MNTRVFKLGFLAFCLGLSSCQNLALEPLPPTTATQPTAMVPTKSSAELAYSQDFAKLYEAFTKTSYRDIQAGPLVLGISTPIPQTRLPVAENGETPAEPVQITEDMAQAQARQERMTLTRRLIEAQIKATETLMASLKNLTPPKALAKDHQLLQDYFQLNQETSRLVLAEAKRSGDEILIAPQPPADFLEAHSDKLKRLEELGPQAANYMQALQLRVYAQERLEYQKGAPLSRASYLAQVKLLFPQVMTVTPTSLFVITYPSLVVKEGSETDKQSLGESQANQKEVIERFETLAAMHPPEDCAEMHTAIYAMARLQKDMLIKMLELLPTLKAAPTSAQLLLELFSEEDLLFLMFSLGPFAAKVPEIAEKLGLNTVTDTPATPAPSSSSPPRLEDLTLPS